MDIVQFPPLLYHSLLRICKRIIYTASFSYRELYTKAFAKLADISQQAEEAMQALEELQLVMGDK